MVLIVVLCAALVMLLAERLRPGRAWPNVSGWEKRALAVSILQGLVVLGFGASFDSYIAGHRLFTFGGERVWLAPTLRGYSAVTFVFYWWHRARHHSDLLWRFLHQFHHSPQ